MLTDKEIELMIHHFEKTPKELQGLKPEEIIQLPKEAREDKVRYCLASNSFLPVWTWTNFRYTSEEELDEIVEMFDMYWGLDDDGKRIV